MEIPNKTIPTTYPVKITMIKAYDCQNSKYLNFPLTN
jgi:hypothetical protein